MIEVKLSLPDDCAQLVPALRELEQLAAFGATSHAAGNWERQTPQEHYSHGYKHANYLLGSVDSASGFQHITHTALRFLMARAIKLAQPKGEL